MYSKKYLQYIKSTRLFVRHLQRGRAAARLSIAKKKEDRSERVVSLQQAEPKEYGSAGCSLRTVPVKFAWHRWDSNYFVLIISQRGECAEGVEPVAAMI